VGVWLLYIIKVVPTAHSIKTGRPMERMVPGNLLSFSNHAMQKQADESSKEINKAGIQGFANNIFILNLLIAISGKKQFRITDF
jgi:hypothetical protein